MREPQTVRLDVRQDIASGGAPCYRIMQAANQLETGDTLELIAPFEPTPLYDVLGQQGFEHNSHELDGGDWEVRFTRSASPRLGEDAKAAPGAPHSQGCGCSAHSEVELDVRGLEPPEPMVRVLEAVEVLPLGTTLRALTDRHPLHLLDQLEARGLRGKAEANPDGSYTTRISRR